MGLIDSVVLLNVLVVLLVVYAFSFPRHIDKEDSSETLDPRLWRVEYETLNGEIERRERSLITMGSIFLPVSFLLMGQAATANSPNIRLLLVWTSIMLYSVWLFAVQITSWRLDEIIYPRLRWLERHIGFEAHRFVGRRIQGSCWIHIRRHHWAIFLIVLFVVAIVIMNA